MALWHMRNSKKKLISCPKRSKGAQKRACQAQDKLHGLVMYPQRQNTTYVELLFPYALPLAQPGSADMCLRIAG